MLNDLRDALLSANAYATSKDVVNPNNAIPLPAGWSALDGFDRNNQSTGFLANVYKNGSGDIVIAYAGTTDNSLDWLMGNVPAATGVTLEREGKGSDPFPSRRSAPTVFRSANALTAFLLAFVMTSYALASDDQKSVRQASVAGSMEALYGKWEGGDSGSLAQYGTMKISASSIAWKGRSHAERRCTVAYRRVPERYDIEFRDQTANKYVTAPGDSRYTTFLLKINGGECARRTTHFRFTLDSELNGYLAYIHYDKVLAGPSSHGHFFRRP